MTCETCGGSRYLIRADLSPVPCPDCHCGQQSCCEGAVAEEEEDEE